MIRLLFVTTSDVGHNIRKRSRSTNKTCESGRLPYPEISYDLEPSYWGVGIPGFSFNLHPKLEKA